MILFRPEHVDPILAGTKTQTRRLGAKRWNVGAVHQARTRMMDASSTFAHLRILEVRRELLHEISAADVRAEGYPSGSPAEFVNVFNEINRTAGLIESWRMYVWVVRFELAEAVAA